MINIFRILFWTYNIVNNGYHCNQNFFFPLVTNIDIVDKNQLTTEIIHYRKMAKKEKKSSDSCDKINDQPFYKSSNFASIPYFCLSS